MSRSLGGVRLQDPCLDTLYPMSIELQDLCKIHLSGFFTEVLR